MAELRCFPVKDGKLTIDFNNVELIHKSILHSFDNNNIDNLLKMLIYFDLEFRPLAFQRSENIIVEYTKDELFSLLNSDKISITYKTIRDSEELYTRTFGIPNVLNDKSYCLNLLNNNDFDYQKKNNTHRVTIIKNDRIITHISDNLCVSLISVYYKNLKK